KKSSHSNDLLTKKNPPSRSFALAELGPRRHFLPPTPKRSSKRYSTGTSKPRRSLRGSRLRSKNWRHAPLGIPPKSRGSSNAWPRSRARKQNGCEDSPRSSPIIEGPYGG